MDFYRFFDIHVPCIIIILTTLNCGIIRVLRLEEAVRGTVNQILLLGIFFYEYISWNAVFASQNRIMHHAETLTLLIIFLRIRIYGISEHRWWAIKKAKKSIYNFFQYHTHRENSGNHNVINTHTHIEFLSTFDMSGYNIPIATVKSCRDDYFSFFCSLCVCVCDHQNCGEDI